jgi:hypothetical protein
MYRAWAFEPTIFDAWVALGFGAWTARLVITIPCVLLPYVAPALLRSTYAYLEPVQFLSIAATMILIIAGSI